MKKRDTEVVVGISLWDMGEDGRTLVVMDKRDSEALVKVDLTKLEMLELAQKLINSAINLEN